MRGISCVQNIHFIWSKRPWENANVVSQVLCWGCFGRKRDSLFPDPSQSHLNSWNSVILPNLSDQISGYELSLTSATKRWVSLDLYSSIFAERDYILRILSHTDMELNLVDGRHNYITSLIVWLKTFETFLTEIRNTNGSCFSLLIHFLKGLPLVSDFHTIQRPTSSKRWKVNQHKINILKLKLFKILLMCFGSISSAVLISDPLQSTARDFGSNKYIFSS